MALSQEVRLLKTQWPNANQWPQRLEWIEITGIRGWTSQRVDFNFPIVALVGENGSGKSTVLQAAASVYKNDDSWFASDFFPDTPFETIQGATIRYTYRQGTETHTKSIRKPTERWLGNPDRPTRRVAYIDLSRIQPVGARVGYSKLLKNGVNEGNHIPFDADTLARLAQILGKPYASAGISFTNADANRSVPVLMNGATRYSGFHQGAGEIAATELLAAAFHQNSLVIIDEIETSLHPRAQRRLIRDLARIARLKQLQILLTTHSPYVLEELPPEGRIYLMDGAAGKTVVVGVSPDFAMTKMDDQQHPECDVYVEDVRAKTFVREAIIRLDGELSNRIQIIPFGTASVGRALGLMKQGNRFPNPTIVFLDGDQEPAPGCVILPGGDAPEVVVFNALSAAGWPGVAERVGRAVADTIDALSQSMLLGDPHEWVSAAASRLYLGGDSLWQATCAAWAQLASNNDLDQVAEPVRLAIAP